MKGDFRNILLARFPISCLFAALLLVFSDKGNAQQVKPFVQSIQVEGNPLSNVDSVTFLVTFSEPVTGVDADDFIIEASKQLKAVKITGVEGEGAKYTISLSGIPEFSDGILSIDLKEGVSITNAAGMTIEGFSAGRYHYVGAAFDVSRAVYAGDAEAFSYIQQEQHAFSLEFNLDGTKMFIMGYNKKTVFEYSLSIPFDVSTAKYAGDKESFFSLDEHNPRSITFDSSGLKMYLVGAAQDSVFEYDLQKQYDISTAKRKGDKKSFSVRTEGNLPYSISFNNDGSKLFIVDLRRGTILEYQLTRPFEISTARYAGDEEAFILNLQGRSAVSLKFNPDGTKVFVLGIIGNDINEYKINVPFDVSTAERSEELEQLLIKEQDKDPRSLTFNEDGTKMFILGNGNDRILEYDLDAKALVTQGLGLWKVVSENPEDPVVSVELASGGVIKLSSKEKNLTFKYGSNSNTSSDEIEYQTILEGAEEFWSAWTSSSARQFDRLSSGSYTFKVKTRNRYGQITEISTLDFEIPPPWYLSIWAYSMYLVLLVFLIWRIVKLNTKRLEKEKKALEEVVSQRTEEISKQKDEIAGQMEEVAQANVMIKEQADRLKELDKVKSRFFANISHELRTPLTLINAPLESLIENGRIEDQDVLETLGVARRNGGSLLALVEEILDLTKLEAGKLLLVKNPVRLYEFISDLASPYEQGMKAKSIYFVIDFKPKTDLTLLLDGNHAGKILNNLISNALKFTEQGGNIKLSVQHHFNMENWLQISVIDDGEGIHAKDLENVFDRFYQAEHSDNKQASGGTGIGLALAKELANLFGGDLTVKSIYGEGSQFTFAFPYEEVNSEVIIPLSEVDGVDLDIALKATVKKYKTKFEVGKPVLLVTEDHPEMRSFIAKTLQPYFEILQAENGKVALEVLRANRIDIVISDVMMPIMDGFELLEEIKKDETLHEISLIMLTARAEQEDKLFALTMGIDDYLTKPFNASEFLARIKNILENRIKILRELKGIDSLSDQTFATDIQTIVEKYDLSQREVEVIQLITKRYSNPEIAEHLHVSRNTVKTHLKNIYSKLAINSRTEVTEKLSEYAE